MAAVTIAASRDWAKDSGKWVVATSGGQLWALADSSGDNTLEFFYSNDDGATWTEDTGASLSSVFAGHSLFMDGRDQIWVIYDDTGGDLNIRRGTISGNAITWGGAHEIINDTSERTHADFVVFAEGTDDRAWVVYKDVNSNALQYWNGLYNGTSWSSTSQSTVATGTTYTCVVDFHHTGDGKTIQSGAPHIYVAWTNSSNQLKFVRYGYTAGPTWTGGTVRTISSTIVGNAYIGGFFDGTRFVMAGVQSDGDIEVHERNAADSSGSDITPGTDPTGGKASNDFFDIYYDASTEDVYILFVNTSDQPVYAKYDRSGTSWDAAYTLIEAEAAVRLKWARNEGGGVASEMLPCWDTGANIRTESGIISLNSPPTTPEIESPSDGQVADINEVLTILWTFNDPDPGDTQSAFSLRRRIGASTQYWDEVGGVWQATEDASTKIASTTPSITLDSLWGSDSDADHNYAVKTWDAADAGPSSWSSEVAVTPSAQDNPTLTAITTVTGDPYTVTWTVATQTSYRVKVYDDAAGSPVTSTVFYNSGQVSSAVTNASVPFPTNNVTRHVGLVTWNDEGLASDEDTEQVEVEYEAPPAPTVSMSVTGTEDGVIFVNINNPAPGAGETVTDSNEVYRRVAAEGGDGIRVGSGVAEDGAFNDYGPLSEVVYQYRARAVNAGNGTGAYGSWTT